MRALGRFALALALAGAPAALLLAHEGHAHRVMGTVASFDAAANRLQVKTTDGRTLDLNVNGTTRYRKGSAASSAAALTPGTRVVVSYMEKSNVKTVTEVLVGGGEAAASPAKKTATKKKTTKK